MTKTQLVTLILSLLAAHIISAQTIWHHPDSLVAMQTEDSISYMEEYSVYTVVRSTDTATTSMIWGITENDTLHTGVLTKGIYSYRAGILHSTVSRNDKLKIIQKKKLSALSKGCDKAEHLW